MSITLRQLEVFALVVKYGSFRKCAEELAVTPVSISEHIRELEQRLNCKIFVRKPGHAATLTKDGKIAYEKAQAVLSELDSLINTFTKTSKNEKKLSLYLQPFLATALIGTIKKFKEDHPNISLQVDYLTENPSAITEKISNHSVDLALFHTFETNFIANSEHVAEEEMAIFVAKDHPLTKLKTVTRSDLACYQTINLLPTNPLRELTDRVMHKANIANNHIGIETDEYGLIVKSLAEGMGFTCMFLSNLNTQATAEKLTCLTLDFELPKLNVQALTATTTQNNSATVALLRETLAATYRSLQQQVKPQP